ncbi:sugar phosphate isomerase/epimerase [Bacillaceae bacterium S4-13-56]
MSKVIIPLNAFDSNLVLDKGQAWFVKFIAQSGAFGIEIRRELFLNQDYKLEEIRNEIMKYNLFTVYSVPIELWNENGMLNKEKLETVCKEAQVLRANWVKVPLGHYHKEKSSLSELKKFLSFNNGIQWFVENDQTIYGGNVENLRLFFEECSKLHIPVKMTFDIGNWYFTDQNIPFALSCLSEYVGYIHLKKVIPQDGLITVPLDYDMDMEWAHILHQFPSNLERALEFPIALEDIQKYVNLVQLDLESSGKIL